MSSKGILPQTRNGSGQIEDLCKKGLSDSLDFLKNGEYGLVSADSVLPDGNQDVAEDCSNGENTARGVLEIASSANFILSSGEVTSDVVGISVDDWFKHKSVGSMDLDSVLTTDCIEMNDLEAYHFAAGKDNVDMCIVTNICDMGLGFDLPVNICDKCNQNVGECDCDDRVVNDFEQTSFLDDLSKTDKEKNMFIKVNNPKLNDKCDILSAKDKEIADSYILQLDDKEVNENSKETDWSQSDDVYSHPIILNGEKVSWEALSSNSQHSTDYESEKEVDFPEFGLLTFQVENSDGINVINSLPQIECVNDTDGVPGSVIVSRDCVLPENVSLVESCSPEEQLISDTNTIATENSIKTQTPVKGRSDIDGNVLDLRSERTKESISSQSVKVESKTKSVNIIKNSPSQSSSSNPRSLLRPSQKTAATKVESSQMPVSQSVCKASNGVSTVVRSEQDSCGLQLNVKKAPAMTIIAISTDKSKNTTEIVINTSQGEQKFKGKTSDFIKATSKLLNSQSVKAKLGQSLNLTNSELGREDPGLSQADEDWMRYEKSKAADEQPITEALAALGIDPSTFTCVSPGGNSGFKLWACPVLDCNKLYPRLSLLKVHILTHYGVRPYRCDVPGCHWTFYTFFKLKRHKETHLKRKAFVCPVPSCGHRFTTIYNLKTHRKLHERPAKLQCPVVGCDARFQTKRAVELHIKKHGISHAPYQCTFAGCGKRYYSNNTLNSHARSHQHREEEVRCQWPDCGKWFDKPCRLKAHMRIHTGDKPYLCTFENCGWAFSSASKLKRHQQKHTNERKFFCSVEGCGKSFMRSEHLKEHTQTHIGERSYQCTVENCGVKFTAKSSLYVHLKKHKQQMKDIGLSSDSPTRSQQQTSVASQPKPMQLLIPKFEPMEDGEAVQLVIPAGAGGAYHCPVESCPKSYSCKSSLRQHLLKHHTPVLASDSNQLDYVTSLLLSGNTNQQLLVSSSDEQQLLSADGLATVALQGPVCTVAVDGEGDLNSTGLLTTDSLFDSVTAFNSEYISSDFLNEHQMLVVTQQEAAEDQVMLQEQTGPAARLLLASDSLPESSTPDADAELHLATESISDALIGGGYNQSRVVTFGLSDLAQAEAEEEEPMDDPTCRAARTNLPYQDVILRKKVHYASPNASAAAVSKSAKSSCDGSVATVGSAGAAEDTSSLAGAVVGLRDPVATLCLPPEIARLVAPSADLNLLLQEDSGLQVLLLDGNDSQFYSESTINLRDLE